MTIIEDLVEAKIARNDWHATAIANGLHLADLRDDSERMKRARLYRVWRDAGALPGVAFQRAIDGRQPMELQMPEPALRND